jgi:outer membrane protein assembly factor BamB
MKTPTFFFLALCASCLFIFSAYTEKKEALPSLKIIQKDSTDILQTVKAWQEQMPKPSDKFRPGHASPRQMEEYLEKKEDGFVIQLPAKSLTPSPTIYKGMVLVSGGFGSKEYYAFDAQTGEVKWAINLDDDGPTSAVVQDDIVVFNTESCTIFACNVMTGELLWSHYLGDPLMSTPSVADGVVYTAYPAQRALGGYQNAPYNYQQQNSVQQMPGNNVGNLTIAPGGNQQGQMEKDSVDLKVDLRPSHIMIALELKTGKILWQKWIDGDIMSAPVVEGDEVLATTFPGTLYKFHAKTGEILAAKAGRATSAPVVVGNDIYMSQRSDDGVSDVRENLSSWDRNMTTVKQSYTRKAPYLDQKVQSKSVLKSTAMNYDAGNGFAGGAPANSGWQQASYNIGQSNVSSLQAFQGSRVLHHQGRNFATMGDTLLCAHPKTGEVYWRQDLKGDLEKEGGFLATPPLMVDGKILVASLNGDIILYHANSGKEWKRYPTGEKIRYQPVLEDGRIYVSTVSGKVLCIDTGEENLTGWPSWGANAAHTNRVK